MATTLVQKIISSHLNGKTVEPGEIVMLPVDVVLGNDASTNGAIAAHGYRESAYTIRPPSQLRPQCLIPRQVESPNSLRHALGSYPSRPANSDDSRCLQKDAGPKSEEVRGGWDCCAEGFNGSSASR